MNFCKILMEPPTPVSVSLCCLGPFGGPGNPVLTVAREKATVESSEAQRANLT